MADTLAPPAALIAFAADVLAAHGIPRADAETVAAHMVEADLHGHDGHGIFRLPAYVERLLAGGFNPHPEIRVDAERGAAARVDGDDAIGHLVVRRCVDEAMARARAHGVGWVGCHRSNHAGAGGVWAMVPVREGLIGIYMAVGSANHMAPWGGAELLLSTNPLAIGVPGGEGGPILLDMATTNVAYGKVKLARDRGEAMPEGWMIDAEGNPLTDPQQSAGGSLLPIGGPKGYGLALMIGLLAGSLNGAALGRDVVDFNADSASPTNTGQAMLVIDPAALGDPAAFRATVDRVRAEMTSSRLRPGFDEIRLPGDRALATRAARTAAGVPIPPPLLARLDRVADHAGVPPLAHRL